MKFTKEQIEELSRLAESAKTDPVGKNVVGLVVLLLEEAKRIFHEGGGIFNEGLNRAILDCMPWELPFYQYLGKLKSDYLLAHATKEELEEMKRLKIIK